MQDNFSSLLQNLLLNSRPIESTGVNDQIFGTVNIKGYEFLCNKTRLFTNEFRLPNPGHAWALT